MVASFKGLDHRTAFAGTAAQGAPAHAVPRLRCRRFQKVPVNAPLRAA